MHRNLKINHYNEIKWKFNAIDFFFFFLSNFRLKNNGDSLYNNLLN